MTSATTAHSGDRDKSPAEIAGQVLDPAHDEGAEITGEIADGVDGGDARRDRRACEKGGRQGPEKRQRANRRQCEPIVSAIIFATGSARNAEAPMPTAARSRAPAK